MSMLAEKKRKQKWSLNPRGNTWAQDTNKFGQKLLEKMGWKEGKGLGANEDGLKEHIKVSYKNDSKGLGFKDQDGWTEHEDNFSALLKDLSNSDIAVKVESSSENASKFKPKSLEKKSQSSRVRVHYHKFTRGKDLSRYSEKDLANIFGKKSLVANSEIPKDKNDGNSNSVSDNENNVNNFGVKTVEGGSMIDYFKAKMSSFSIASINGTKEDNNSDSYDEFSTVGFGFSSTFSKNNSQDKLNNSKKKKKKDKSSSNNSFSFESENEIQPNTSNCTNDESTEIKIETKKSKKRKLDDNCEITPKKSRADSNFLSDMKQSLSSSKKKKKKKKTSVNDNSSSSNEKLNFGLSNPAFDPLFNKKITIEKHTLNMIKEDGELSPNLSNTAEKLSSDLSLIAEENHTMIKKKKRKSTEINRDCNEVCEDILTGNDQKKKRKKDGNEDKCFENPNFDTNQNCNDSKQIIDNCIYEVTSKKKKKKKNNCGIENPIFSDNSPSDSKELVKNDSTEQVLLDNSVNKIKPFKEHKMKSKDVLNGIINPSFIENSPEDSFQDPSNNFEIPNKPKKSKKKCKLNGIENPSLNVSSENDSVQELSGIETNSDILRKNSKDQDLENNEPKISKKKHKLNGIENSSLNISSDKDSVHELSTIESTTDTPQKHENYGSVTSTSDFVLNVSDEPDIMLNISFGAPEYLTQKDVTRDKNINDSSSEMRSLKSNVKRRKSVRFSDVNEEREIPNRFDDYYSSVNNQEKNDLLEINSKVFEESLKNDQKDDIFAKGLINEGFDYRKDRLESNIQMLNKKFEAFQAEVENDINESKVGKGDVNLVTNAMSLDRIMIGEPVSDGENEKLEHGTKLRLKYAEFGKTPYWMRNSNTLTYARKSYRHLIKGDIIVHFKNTNLHEISGYGKNISSTVRRLSNSVSTIQQ